MTAGAGRQAAILSGGAAYAAYEVGILKALTGGECAVTGFRPPELDVFAGTSAGSFNAAVMASRPQEPAAATAAYLERVWLDGIAATPQRCGSGAVRYRGNPVELLTAACYIPNPLRPWADLASDAAYFARDLAGRFAAFAFSGQPLARRLLGFANLGSFISTAPYSALLRQALDLGGVRRSDKVLLVAATNWFTGGLQLFGNADMTEDIGHDIILASSAFPGVPPVTIRGQPYGDGGFVLNTPLKPAVAVGADVLHVVYLDPDISQIPLQRMQNTIDTMDRSIAIFMATVFNRDIDCANDVNTGLSVMDGSMPARELTADQVKAVLRLAGIIENRELEGIPFRKVTVHRYHPRDDLGGVIGLLNFDRDQMVHLIQRGFHDAVHHDCAASGCLLPP